MFRTNGSNNQGKSGSGYKILGERAIGLCCATENKW